MSKATTFSPEEISIFCDQIAMILNGGIPIFEGTHIIYEEMDEGRTKDILKKVDDNVKSGLSFNEALKESGAFPTYMKCNKLSYCASWHDGSNSYGTCRENSSYV